MIRKIFSLLFLTVSFSTIKAQDTSTVATQQFVVADEVAAIVGNSPILLSDIENMATRIVEMRKTSGTLSDKTEKEEAFEMLLTQHLLVTRAQIDSLDKEMSSVESEVEQNIQQMATNAGGITELERKMGKPIYQIRADVTLDTKRDRLSREMERKIRSTAKISHGEVRKFINTIPLDSMDLIPAQYVYSHIVKAPEQTDERRYAIREQLLEYRKRILAGEISLGVLAQLYSSDPGTAKRRGEMGPMSAKNFVPQFPETAKELSPGEVSEIVETEYGYHLIELISYDQVTDMLHIRHILLKPEFTVEESMKVSAELDSIANEIRIGAITFEDAAIKFSTDVETKENGGKAYNKQGYYETQGDIRAASSRFMLEELGPDYRQISILKPGEISSPFESMDNKGNKVYKIIRLDKIIPAHVANVDDDFDFLQTVALRFKENEVIQKWITDMIEKTYIEIKPEYMGYNFDRPGWKIAAQRSATGKNVKLTERPRPTAQSTSQTASK